MKLRAANDNTPHTLADQLRALREHRNRPDHEPEPVVSNWMTEPESNNGEPEVLADLHAERRHEIIPSISMIMRQCKKPIRRSGNGKNSPIVSIGKLRFSDGEQHERAHKRGPGGAVVAYPRKMPLGAMLGCREDDSKLRGGGQGGREVETSNTEFSKLFGVEYRAPITGGIQRKGKDLTPKQSRELIAKAFANTPNMPPVTVCPPGLPTGTARASDCFIGCKISSTGKGGAMNWEDVYSAKRDAEEYRKARDKLGEKTRKILEALLTAGTFTEIGVAAGQSEGYARYGGGRRALIAANDDLETTMKEVVGG